MTDDERYLLLFIMVTFSPWMALAEPDENEGGRVGMVTPVGPVVFDVPPAHWPLFDSIRRTREPFPEVSPEETRARLRQVAAEFNRRLAEMKAAADASAASGGAEPS